MRNIVNDTQFLSERATMMYYFQDEFYNPEKTEIFIHHQGSLNLKSITITM